MINTRKRSLPEMAIALAAHEHLSKAVERSSSRSVFALWHRVTATLETDNFSSLRIGQRKEFKTVTMSCSAANHRTNFQRSCRPARNSSPPTRDNVSVARSRASRRAAIVRST